MYQIPLVIKKKKKKKKNKPATLSTELEDTFKLALSKLSSALMSPPKEPSFSDIIIKSTVLVFDLNASLKNHYLYCKNCLLVWICLCFLNEHHPPKDHWL